MKVREFVAGAAAAFNFSLMMLLMSFSAVGHAEELLISRATVSRIAACIDPVTKKPFQSNISTNDIQLLFEKKLFPGPFDAMGEFIAKAEKLDQWNNRHGLNCPRFGYVDDRIPQSVQLALSDVASETTKLIKADIAAQRALLAAGEICAKKLAEVTAAGKAVSAVKIEDFRSLKGQIPNDEECFGFSTKMLPELSEKLKRLRVLMVVAEDPDEKFSSQEGKWGQRVRHDKPFSQDLAANFFPTVWKKNSTDRLRGLSPLEMQEAAKMAREVPWTVAKSEYYQMLSNNPVLLFFDNEVTPAKLADAYKEMKLQTSQDLEKTIDGMPQEIMLMMPYVQVAIGTLPPAKRGDACVVLGQIFENLNKRYEKFPRFVAQLGVAAMVVGGLGGATIKEGIALAVRFAARSATVYGMVMTKDSLAKYQRGVAMCSVQVVPSHLCDFEATDELYRKGQSHVVGSVLSGTLLFGVGRIISPPR